MKRTYIYFLLLLLLSCFFRPKTSCMSNSIDAYWTCWFSYCTLVVWLAGPIKSTFIQKDTERLSLKDIAKNKLAFWGKPEFLMEIAPFSEMYNKENTHRWGCFWFQSLFIYTWKNISIIHIMSIPEINYVTGYIQKV